jgi:hypothetical protein
MGKRASDATADPLVRRDQFAGKFTSNSKSPSLLKVYAPPSAAKTGERCAALRP